MEQVTTNAVLEEKIDGLTKLTDERFNGIKASLTRIELANSTYATKTELDEVKKDFNKSIKEIHDSFAQHNVDDKESFGVLSRQLSSLGKTIYIAMGGGTVILFISQYVIPSLIKK